jgi:hypothetical protein
VVFIVEGDGRELWRSGEVRKDSPPQPVRVSVTGVRALVLRTVSAAGGKPGGAAVNWCDGRVMRK